MEKTLTKDNFISFISDPGIQLSHPGKEKIVLEDIFVFPELKHETQGITSSKELLNIGPNGSKTVISGIEDSGKTTLVKALIKEYLESGYYPIYIDIETYTFSNSERFIEKILREYGRSYGEGSNSRIKRLSKQKKVLFIDNFDKLNCSSDVIADILRKLYNIFYNVTLTEKIPANSIANSQLRSVFAELNFETQYYEILEFSDELRLELIRKWNKIGSDDESDIENIKADIEKTRKFMDAVIGQNLVPSYPIYLLTILQMDNHEDPSASTSSFGHYHEYLIIKSLHKSIGNESIHNYFDLLSNISFYMFDRQKERLSDEELESIFNESLVNALSYDFAIKTLLKSETLIKDMNLYQFKYKYAYHYFVAKYLAENIDSESVKGIIKELCSDLGNDNVANIVLFITHLTDDSFMIDELSIKAESIFSDIDNLADIEDSPAIDELVEELSRLGAKERKLKEIVAGYASTKGSTGQLDFQKKRQSLNAAHNLARIMRQILKK